VPAYEVTTMPLPQGNCTAKMPEEATRAGIEGVVVLDIVVGADGRVRSVRVVKSVGHGCDEVAIAAIKACTFSAGRRGDDLVPVRIREFKYHFLQPDE
jgi:protein TonB